MPQWLERLLQSPIPALLDLLSNVWWFLGLLLAGLLWVVYRSGLWRRCDERNLEDWLLQLEHTDESVRSDARRKLLACRHRAVSLLVDAIQETDREERRELVVNVLCEIGTSALRPLLVMRKEQSISSYVDRALEQHLPSVVERKQYGHDRATLWKRLWNRSARSESGQIADRLITLLNDVDPFVQQGAALALGRYPRPEVVNALGRKLYPTECGHQEVRETAADSLGRTKRVEAIPFLEIGLKDFSHNVRLAACQALAQIKQPEAVRGLEEVILHNREIPLVRIEAAKALGHIGGAAAMEVLKKVSSSLPKEYQELRDVVGDELAEIQRKLHWEDTYEST